MPPMPMASPMAMGGPPVPPPDVPSITSLPVSQGETEGKRGALPRLFFVVDQALDDIARAVPGSSEQIDGIKDQLKEILSGALEEGEATAPSARPSPPMASPMGGGGGLMGGY